MTAATGGGAGRRSVSPVVAQCVVAFCFGMPIAMLGVAWPQIRGAFGRSNADLGVLAVAYGVGRLATSGSSGAVLRRVSYGRTTTVAVAVVGGGSLLIVAAPNWPALVAAVAFVGAVSGLLDSLGARFLANGRSVSHAGLITGFYGIGATFGPGMVALTDRWELSYGVAGAIGIAAGVAGFVLPIRWPVELDDPPRRSKADTHPAHPPVPRLGLLLSLGMFFAFIGVEVTTGQWTASLLEDARHVDHRLAGLAVSAFWAGLTAGRLLLARLRLSHPMLVGSALALVGLLIGVAVLPRSLAVPIMLLAGLALSPMAPTLFAQTADRVGAALAQTVSGWQLISANVAGIGLPALTGLLVGSVTEYAPTFVVVTVAALGVAFLVLVFRRPPIPHPGTEAADLIAPAPPAAL